MMDKGTLKALKKSIEHWEENAKASKKRPAKLGPEECALCVQFISNSCRGCPVRESTGRMLCTDSPYEDCIYAWAAYLIGQSTLKEFRAAAKRELQFLKSLLPTEETP